MSVQPFLALLAGAACFLVAGSGDPPATRTVMVANPVVLQMTDYQDFNGRTEAAQRVDLRARVSGYVNKTPFKEGSMVHKGDVLFEIDPRPYQADMDRTRAAVALAEARLRLADAECRRAKDMPKGTVGPAELDKVVANREKALAEVRLARANQEAAQLNLDFTRVQAPIAGRIGRRLVDPGNLVRADETRLATIVTQEPIYVSFEIDERTWLRLRRLVNQGKARGAQTPVSMGLVDEEGYPHQGVVDFVSNEVEAPTGTIRIRAIFPHLRPPRGERLLLPGMFVRIRLAVGNPHEALLVPDQAIGSDQGQRFVLVVNGKNQIERRQVQFGALQDGLRVVQSGLKRADRVVINGQAHLRPGMAVHTRIESIPHQRQ